MGKAKSAFPIKKKPSRRFSNLKSIAIKLTSRNHRTQPKDYKSIIEAKKAQIQTKIQLENKQKKDNNIVRVKILNISERPYQQNESKTRRQAERNDYDSSKIRYALLTLPF